MLFEQGFEKRGGVTNINRSKNISQVRFSDKGSQVKFPNKTSYKKEIFDFLRYLDFRITNAGLQVYNKTERSEVRSIVYWFLEIHVALEDGRLPLLGLQATNMGWGATPTSFLIKSIDRPEI